MGYGGPRVEFYTANQYANYASAIQREDAARVRSILHRRDAVPESEQLRQREETFRAYEAAKAAEEARLQAEEAAALEKRKRREERQQRRLATRGVNNSLSAAEVTALRARQARLTQLAQPRPLPAAYGSTTYGCTMHQRGCKVQFPVGRNNTIYTPGVDRDRLIPPRPVLDNTNTPPWIGSYSTHHGPREAEQAVAKEEAAYYCGKPSAPRSAAEEATKQATLRGIAAAHAADEEQRQELLAASRNDNGGDSAHAAATPHSNKNAVEDDAVDKASVFSHGSSNGPICATGNQHVCTTSTKNSVQLHLSRYGGAMTAPRPQKVAEKASAKDCTLQELSYRLVRMQAPSSQRK